MLEIFVISVCVCVCCVDQRLQKAFTCSTLIKIISQFKAQTLSDLVGSKSVRVGSRVKGSGPASSLSWKYVAELYIRCTCIAEMVPHLPMQKKNNKKRKLWLPPPRDDFRKCAYLCMPKFLHFYDCAMFQLKMWCVNNNNNNNNNCISIPPSVVTSEVVCNILAKTPNLFLVSSIALFTISNSISQGDEVKLM